MNRCKFTKKNSNIQIIKVYFSSECTFSIISSKFPIKLECDGVALSYPIAFLATLFDRCLF